MSTRGDIDSAARALVATSRSCSDTESSSELLGPREVPTAAHGRPASLLTVSGKIWAARRVAANSATSGEVPGAGNAMEAISSLMPLPTAVRAAWASVQAPRSPDSGILHT
jgi:hypothetical protein